MLTEITDVLARQGMLILFLSVVIFTGTLVSVHLLKRITENSFSAPEYFSLGMSAWSIPLLLLALPSSSLLQLSDVAFRIIAVFILMAALAWIWPLLRQPAKISVTGALLFSLLILSIAANLLLLSNILFPAYFDSVEHYRIIKFLLRAPWWDAGKWPTVSYYHIGYHMILAVLIKLTGAGIIDVMLVSGQLLLSTLAISLFFIISRETRSNTAALFTTGLGAFGWYMPEHAVNWGKYPALLGFSTTLLVFGLTYLIFQNPRSWLNIKKLIPFVGAVAAAGILHTRALVACGLFAAALFLTSQWDLLEIRTRRVTLGVFLISMAAAALYLRTDGTFATLFSSYLENDLPIIPLILFLGLFAVWKFPRLAFALLLLISMTCMCLYVPVNGWFGYQSLYLLDRPYAQILLHIPFSFLGGLGLAGLLEVTSTWQIGVLRIRPVIQLTAFVLLAVNAIFYQKYDPSPCCALAGSDDLAAFSWIQELPQNPLFLIAAQNLSFTPDTSGSILTGIDAGLWVNAMTDKRALPFSSGTDFSQPTARAELCSLNANYIYQGNKSGSFNEASLTAKPEWYQVVFQLPDVRIYQVIGCPSS